MGTLYEGNLMEFHVMWKEDEILERKMDGLEGVQWEVIKVQVKYIDFEESKKNNARLKTPFMKHLAEQYAEVQKTDAMPRIAVRAKQDGNHRFSVLSGVHRLAAAIENKQKEIEVYLVDCEDPLHYDFIIRCSNSWHGEKQDQLESVVQAMYMIDNHGISENLAATLVCLRVDYLRKQIRHERKRIELEGEGVRTDYLGFNHLVQLFRLDFSKQLQKEAAHFVNRTKINATELKPIVQAMIDARSEEGGSGVLKQKEKDMRLLKEPRKRGARAPKATLLKRYLSQLNGQATSIKSLRSIGLRYNSEATDQIRASWFELRRKMDALFGAPHNWRRRGGN